MYSQKNEQAGSRKDLSDLKGFLNLPLSEQQILTEIHEELNALDLLSELPSEFTLTLDNFSWDEKDYDHYISLEALKIITSLVLDRLTILSIPFTLNFSSCYIGDEGAEAIGEILSQSHGNDLSLSMFLCKIGEQGFAALAKSLSSETCKLSRFTLEMGQQEQDDDDDYGVHDNINGQIQLSEVLVSPHCINDMVIDFKYLTPEYAEIIAMDMRLNLTCFIKFENQNSPHVTEIVFLNERNRLLKKYPDYKEQILSFYYEVSSPEVEKSTLQESGLFFTERKKYDEQTPQELVQFFSSIVNIDADRADKAKILTIKNANASDLFSLCQAINANTEFTTFTNPQISNPQISWMDQNNLMSLLKQTAYRNKLIKELSIEPNEILLTPSQFSLQLLISLQDKKTQTSPEITALALKYFSEIFDQTYVDPIAKGTHFLFAVKTGIKSIAEEFFDYRVEVDENLILGAIESSSEEMILWLSERSRGKNIINQQSLHFAQQQLANYPSGSREKENLSKGLIIFKKLLKDQKIQEVMGLISKNNCNQLKLILSSTDMTKDSLIDFMNFALRNKSDKETVELLLEQLGNNFEINQIGIDEFIYFNSLDILSVALNNDFFKHHYSEFNKEQMMQLIRQKKFPQQFLLMFIEQHLERLTSDDLSHITENYPLNPELLSQFLILSPQKLIENDLIKVLYLKYPEIMREVILNRQITELVQKGTSIPALALLMAAGFDYNIIKKLAINKNLDFISIVLIAASYPHTKINSEKGLIIFKKAAFDDHFSFDTHHHVLAKKLNNRELDAFVTKTIHGSDEPISSEKLEAIKFLQGAIRIKNRVSTLYPTLFKKSENSYSFWLHDKPLARMRQDAFDKNIWNFSTSYLKHHEIGLTNGDVLYFISPYTYQHILGSENLEKIFNCGYLLSQKARSDLVSHQEMMPSLIDKNDRLVQDDYLVCTAPFELLNNNLKHVAKIRINLSKISSYLSHSIIKIDAASDGGSKKIEIAPSIIMKSEQRLGRSIYSFIYTSLDGQQKKYSLPVDNEIFHGVKGFKEMLNHFLAVINDHS